MSAALLLLVTQVGVTFALDAPSIYFSDSAVKADYLTAVEGALREALKTDVQAALSDSAQADIVLGDAAAVTLRDEMQVVLSATRNGRQSWTIGVLATSPGRPIDLLQQGAAVPAGDDASLRALRYAVFLDDPAAASALTHTRKARDSRGAVAAVASGESRAALVPIIDYGKLDARFNQLQVVAELRDVPMPVVALNRNAHAFADALRRAKLPPLPGVITDWAPASSPELDRLRGAVRSRTSVVPRNYATPRGFAMVVDVTPLVPPGPANVSLDPLVFIPAPRLAPLPDFVVAPTQVAVSRR